MTKTKERWKKSEILQEVLPYLAMDLTQTWKERFVCFALGRVVQYRSSTYEQVQEIEAYINKLLVTECGYECDSYEEWLDIVHRVTFEEKNTPEGFKKLQYSRKQWMLWMIEHFKQQGD